MDPMLKCLDKMHIHKRERERERELHNCFSRTPMACTSLHSTAIASSSRYHFNLLDCLFTASSSVGMSIHCFKLCWNLKPVVSPIHSHRNFYNSGTTSSLFESTHRSDAVAQLILSSVRCKKEKEGSWIGAGQRQ
jgi:hypothetical protein